MGAHDGSRERHGPWVRRSGRRPCIACAACEKRQRRRPEWMGSAGVRAPAPRAIECRSAETCMPRWRRPRSVSADTIWDLAKASMGVGRRLGHRREGPLRRRERRDSVRHAARHRRVCNSGRDAASPAMNPEAAERLRCSSCRRARHRRRPPRRWAGRTPPAATVPVSPSCLNSAGRALPSRL